MSHIKSIERTKQKNYEHLQEQGTLGWKVVVLWGCQLRGDFEKSIKIVSKTIRGENKIHGA